MNSEKLLKEIEAHLGLQPTIETLVVKDLGYSTKEKTTELLLDEYHFGSWKDKAKGVHRMLEGW
jgi:hypothetical protein